jgi:hypothetical protein
MAPQLHLWRPMSVGFKRKAFAGPRLAAALVLTTMAIGGCSFALVDGAPSRDKWPSDNRWALDLNHCTGSPVAPIADGAFALGLWGSAVYVARGGGDAAPAIAGLIMIPAVIYLASSFYGFNVTSKCRTYLAGPPYFPESAR